jgi:Domain of unknown function (DUF4258)
MSIRLHAHAIERMLERGATENEVITTVEQGERFNAKYGRTGFRRNFSFDNDWLGRYYRTKQIEAFAVEDNGDWLVITVITRYY